MFTRATTFGVLLAGSLLLGAVAYSSSPGPRAAQLPSLPTSTVLVHGALHGTAEYSAAGVSTWVAPPGVYSVCLELWGAGGGGSRPYGYQSAGDGGGSGAYVRTVVAVHPGRFYLLTVGDPGLGATPPAAFGTPGGVGGVTQFATSSGDVLAWAGGGFGGNDANDGKGGIADPGAQIRRIGRDGGHGFGITPGTGGQAWLGSLEPPTPLGGGSGGVGQINASGGNGSAGYAVLLW